EKLTVTDGTALTAEQLPVLTESGYTFGGWYDGETKAEAGYKVTKDVTLTANWTKNTVTPTPDDGEDDGGDTGKTTTYTVTFTTNGGTAVTSQKIESGKTATEPAAPTKDGYTFGGWFTDSGFTTAFSFSSEITADITLYAKWIEASKPTYTVTFSVDGAETKQTVAEGEKVSKPTDPTKTGYTFAGWYNGESAFDFETAITENLTLTARWLLVTYSITYNVPDGTTNPNTAASYTIETDTITLLDVSHNDYNSFEGWFDAETGGNKVTSIPKGSTGAKTLYARLYYGTKLSTAAKEVGDIVFNDGSATPYSTNLSLTDAQKAAAVAVIFYKGTGLNSDTFTAAEKVKMTVSVSASDTTTVRTLGVGLKQKKDDTGSSWCLEGANAYTKNITTIQCSYDGTVGAYTFTGDKDGSDNLKQIEDFDGIDDTAIAANYPAFYFAKNYKDTATNVTGTKYETGWYLPSVAELFQIFVRRSDINAASNALGGDNFTGGYYTSSTQWPADNCYTYKFDFSGNENMWKVRKYCCDDYYLCAIREFN
ncbi:MAG: InlB B-repeat-containing protein, partial [Treponema sp.]|nr:InlB B-repeat-containing protein [Treponema sp.]